MRKLLFLLLVSMLFISSASAFLSFADYKEFKADNAYGSIDIWDGKLLLPDIKLATHTLQENTNVCFVNCYAQGSTTLYEDGVLFDSINFYNGNVKTQEIWLGHYETQKEERPIMENQCTQGKTMQSCTEVQTGSEVVEKQVFVKDSLYTNDILPAGTYDWRIEAKKGVNDNIEWVAQVGSIQLSEWASWNSTFTNNLTSYWNFDTANLGISNGTFAQDVYLGAHNGTVINAVNGTTGLLGQAYNWSTTGANVKVNITDGYGVDSASSNVTFSIWARSADTVAGSYVAQKGFGVQWNGWLLWLGNGDTNKGQKWELWFSDAATFNTNIATSYTAKNNSWYNLVIRQNATTVSFFVNGTLVGEDSIHRLSDAQNAPLIIGNANSYAGGSGFNGLLDEASVWNRSLTDNEIIALYNGGAGITYATAAGLPLSITNTLSIPINNTNQTSTSMFFNSTQVVTNGNSTNSTIYVWYTNSTIFNQTTNTVLHAGSNTTSWTINNFPDGTFLWNTFACGTNVTDHVCNWSAANRTFNIDSASPKISIFYPSGVIPFGLVGQNISLNYSITDTTLSNCWFQYENTNRSIPCTDNSTFILNTTQILTIYANDTFGNVNSTNTTWTYSTFQNSNTFNATSYETAKETFITNVTGLVNASLVYSGTNYSASINGTIATRSIDIPLGVANNSWYWTFNGNTINSTTYYQNVLGANLTLCSSAVPIPFINITFKDESNNSFMSGTTDSSSWVYWLGSGAINKTLSYTNNTANPSYGFCFSPASRVLSSTLQYKYAQTGYPQRTWQPTLSLSNNTMNQTLYLLSSSSGLYVSFQILSQGGNPVNNAYVVANRTDIGSAFSGFTDNSGIVTFWLNPNFAHLITVNASGFPFYSTSITPTQSSYTIVLGSSGSTNQSDYTQGITGLIEPISPYLLNGTIYNFNFTLTSTYWQVSTFGFTIANASGTILASTSANTNGGIVSLNLNTGQNTTLVGNYFWIINGNYTNSTKIYIIQNTADNQWSLYNFFTDLSAYANPSSGTGIFGLTPWGLSIIIFIIIFIFVGIMSYQYGITSTGAIMFLIFSLVAFVDFLGLIPKITPTAIVSFPTVFVGIVTIAILIRENMY